MDNLKHVRAQGREAKRLNDEENHNITAHNCPYGPGDNRDAWMAGFGGEEEAVEQVDTSQPTTEDVRTETAKTVRAAPKGKSRGKKAAGKDGNPATGADAIGKTTVRTDTTGTGETALTTKVESSGEAASGIETTVGDPAATDGDPTAAGIDSPVAPQGDAAAKLAKDLM